MKKQSYLLIILILGALSTVSPFSIDMYLPGFNAIARDLHTTVDRVQLSLTSYFIGISVGQIIYGPLLDRFGRKAPLYVGLSVYVITSFGCAFVESVDMLIGMRFLQALGGCVGLVASRALVRDLFPVSETAKVFSLLMLVLAVSPMLAPTVGGYVTDAFGWHSIFIILGVITTCILVGCFFYLPAGNGADPTLSLRPKAILQNYFTVFKHPQFYTYALSGGIVSAVTYAYIAGSPDVFLNIYKVNEKQYGWVFAFIAAGIIGSNQVNRLFLNWYKSEQLIFWGLLWQIFFGGVLITGILLDWFGLYSIIAVIFLFMCGQGFTNPNAAALCLAPFSRLAGSASALLGAIQLGFGAVSSGLVSIFHNHSSLPMAVVMIGCSLLSLILLQAGTRSIKRRDKEIKDMKMEVAV